jgi:SAM-dependent MidA family methyltransferase
MNASLPEPTDDAKAASAALVSKIADEIRQRDGWISFARYMELALYCPGLGYYAGGSEKFGEGGDFVTAPELTPLFGHALAVQVAQVLHASAPEVLEVGAGSGHLAADLLIALDALGCPVSHYRILELSGELAARQRATITARASQFANKVEWLHALPENIVGCVIGNEVLDAMPNHRVVWGDSGVMESGVALDAGGAFVMSERPADASLQQAALALPVAADYRSEIALAARAWTAELGRRLTQGVLLLIDYGLPRHEYYHPQRDGGTIRCHYRHRTHEAPFWYPGLCDITAHVDFTAIAEAAHGAGLDVLGYTAQANFLMNCGIGDLLSQRKGDVDAATAARAGGAVNVLLSPNEMGELFKVIALGRGVRQPLIGFNRGDRLHTL